MQTPTELIQAVAKDLSPERWHQGGWGVDSDDNPVDISNNTGCKWCLMASVFRNAETENLREFAIQAIGAAIVYIGYHTPSFEEEIITHFNDAEETTHNQMQHVLDIAQRITTLIPRPEAL